MSKKNRNNGQQAQQNQQVLVTPPPTEWYEDDPNGNWIVPDNQMPLMPSGESAIESLDDLRAVTAQPVQKQKSAPTGDIYIPTTYDGLYVFAQQCVPYILSLEEEVVKMEARINGMSAANKNGAGQIVKLDKELDAVEKVRNGMAVDIANLSKSLKGQKRVTKFWMVAAVVSAVLALGMTLVSVLLFALLVLL